MNALKNLSSVDKAKVRSAIKRINTQKVYLNKEYPGLSITNDINDFFEKFPQTKSGNISTKGLDESQLNAILYADRKAKYSIQKRKEEIEEALDGYDIGDINSKEDFYKADDIIQELNEYIEQYIVNNYSLLMEFEETNEKLRETLGRKKSYKELEDIINLAKEKIQNAKKGADKFFNFKK